MQLNSKIRVRFTECFLLKRRDARTAIALKLVIPVSRDQSAPADVLAADMPIETSAAPEAPEAPEAPAEPQNAAAGLNEEYDMPTETDAAAVAQEREGFAAGVEIAVMQEYLVAWSSLLPAAGTAEPLRSDLRASSPSGSGTCIGRRPMETTSGSAHGRSAPTCGSTAQPPWTQTGVPSGTDPESQMKSIAWVLTRTQPCDAG